MAPLKRHLPRDVILPLIITVVYPALQLEQDNLQNSDAAAVTSHKALANHVLLSIGRRMPDVSNLTNPHQSLFYSLLPTQHSQHGHGLRDGTALGIYIRKAAVTVSTADRCLSSACGH